MANANFHRGRNTKDTVTVVKERKKEEEEEDRAWAVLSSSSFTAEDPPLFPFGPLFLNYGVRILYLFIFPIPDAVCFVGVDLCVYKRRDVVYYKRSSLVFLYNAV